MFRAIGGGVCLFNTPYTHGVGTMRGGLDGRNGALLKIRPSAPPQALLPTPSSQSTLCTCLSLTKHTPGGVHQLSVPLTPGPREHRPPWQAEP